MKLFLSIVFVTFVGLVASCGGGGIENTSEKPGAEAVKGSSEDVGNANVLNGAPAEVPGAKSFTVQFEKGKTTRSYQNSVGSGGKHTYLLGGSKGQIMKASITSPANYALFTVLDPVGNKLSDGETGNRVFEKVLPADGNYKIVVSSAEGTSEYSIDFSVSALESADDEDITSSGPGGLVTTVKFAKGKSSVTYEDAVIRGERNTYVLGANAGQTMNVDITSLEDNAVFQISGPNGYLAGTEPGEDAKRWSGKLPANGNYKVIVGGTRGNATYKVSFSIK